MGTNKKSDLAANQKSFSDQKESAASKEKSGIKDSSKTENLKSRKKPEGPSSEPSHKTKQAMSQKQRENSLGGGGDSFDNSTELKHFKRSRLFEKFCKEKTDLKFYQTEPIGRQKQGGSGNPTKTEAPLGRSQIDDYNISGRPHASILKTGIRKSSPPKEKFDRSDNESEEDDNQDLGREFAARSRSKVSLGDPLNRTNNMRLRDDSNAFDLQTQSFNLNYNSASQYLPVFPQMQPYMNYPGAMPYYGFGLSSALDPLQASQKNLATEPQTSAVEQSDISLLKGKVAELTRALERENEMNKVTTDRFKVNFNIVLGA